MQTMTTSGALTDRELSAWQHSNPKGYAEWFFAQMGPTLEAEQLALAEAASVDIEDVPFWRVRTPLQRVVQLLKRHRDVHFSENHDQRPVSIVITTLAAQSYQHETDLYDALRGVSARMPDYIEQRDGKWWIPNPAHPDENFADKWNEDPALKKAFLDWLHLLQSDLATAAAASTHEKAEQVLRQRFRLGTQAALALRAVPALASISHVRPPEWPVQVRYKCRAEGYAYTKTKGRKLWKLTNRPLPKGYSLKFRAFTNAPHPYEIRWQVTNTGTEAAADDGLRGRFYPSDSPGVRWERTKYAGTHFVEAFVIKNDVCFARSGRVLVRIRG